jgi:hypothetical protein
MLKSLCWPVRQSSGLRASDMPLKVVAMSVVLSAVRCLGKSHPARCAGAARDAAAEAASATLSPLAIPSNAL